jgi:predicted SAM-dependent methyltransferase
MKLIVGAKKTSFPGWLSTDLRDVATRLGVRNDEDWARRFTLNSLDAIVAEHVLEHMEFAEGLRALRNFQRYLKPGGRVRIAVPDAFNPNTDYQEHCRPGGSGQSWARLLLYAPDEPEHKVHYSYQTLSELMRSAGLTPHLIEYHDATGVFHRNGGCQINCVSELSPPSIGRRPS